MVEPVEVAEIKAGVREIGIMSPWKTITGDHQTENGSRTRYERLKTYYYLRILGIIGLT